MKVFKSLDEQIRILMNRGLKINDMERAKGYLLINGYYKVINGYSKFFMVGKEDRYLPGTNFEEVTQLYAFDTEMKVIFLEAIIQAENHIKHITAHKFAEATENERYAYLDKDNYDQSDILFVGNVISNFSRILNYQFKQSSANNPVKHYITKHEDVPIWIIIDYLDLGDLIKFISNLPAKLQNSIAKEMTYFIQQHVTMRGQFTPELLLSYMQNIRELRNVAAHGNRMLDFNTRQNAKYFKDIFRPLGIKNTRQTRTVYDVFIILQCFLDESQYGILHNTLRKRFYDLENNLDTLSINVILNNLGFPADWHKSTNKLKQ